MPKGLSQSLPEMIGRQGPGMHWIFEAKWPVAQRCEEVIVTHAVADFLVCRPAEGAFIESPRTCRRHGWDSLDCFRANGPAIYLTQPERKAGLGKYIVRAKGQRCEAF
jgi:hypothetical protein